MTIEHVSTMKNKDVTEGDVRFFYIGTNDKTKQEVFAVPGGKIEGRENAIHAARNLIRSNPRMKGKLNELADKVVTRLTSASREGVDLVLGV